MKSFRGLLRQHPRLKTRCLEMGFGCGRKLLPTCTKTGTSVSGTIPATAPSPRAYPRSLSIRSSPFHWWKSPHQNPIGSPPGRSRTPSVSSSWFRPLSNTDKDALNRRSPRARHQWTIHRPAMRSHPCPQHVGSVFGRHQSGVRMTREKEEELSGHTGRIKRQRTRSRLSDMYPKWRWTRWRSKTVFYRFFFCQK